jgi:hypothetical protein
VSVVLLIYFQILPTFSILSVFINVQVRATSRWTLLSRGKIHAMFVRCIDILCACLVVPGFVFGTSV